MYAWFCIMTVVQSSLRLIPLERGQFKFNVSMLLSTIDFCVCSKWPSFHNSRDVGKALMAAVMLWVVQQETPFTPSSSMAISAPLMQQTLNACLCMHACLSLGHGVIIAWVAAVVSSAMNGAPSDWWLTHGDHCSGWSVWTLTPGFYSFLVLWPDPFRHLEPQRCTLYICTLLIMDHLVNNAAERWHCTTFPHESSFSLCRSLPPLRPSSQNNFICSHRPSLSAFAQWI